MCVEKILPASMYVSACQKLILPAGRQAAGRGPGTCRPKAGN